ncbi:MAG: serine hydrolase, partial [Anaerolineae bacterium]|nr:serine hydrolase [Anaerolineae bacterium]
AYPVTGRSALYPWIVIALSSSQQGWVFRDVVKVTGNINSVPITETSFDASPVIPTDTLAPTSATSSDITGATATEVGTSASPTVENATGVLIEAQGELNVRFGPGVDYPRIGILQAGERFPVTRRHTQVEWLEINYNGKLGWVYIPAVMIIGNLNSVPTTSLIDFGYPTLTPTLPMVVTAFAPWNGTSVAPTGLAGVANNIYDLLLAQGFDPSTSRQGSVFLMDLRTGESYSMNPNVAFSGMSLMKIPVMVSFYRKLNNIPTLQEAQTAADMIVCSENLSSNAVLRTIGGGNEYRGAEFVVQTLRALGIENTFLVGPFFVGQVNGQPAPTVEQVNSIQTQANQTITDPDPFNQATPADLGLLLGDIYQCALDGTGPLITTFPGEITMNECRQMMRMMRSNRVAALIGGGVPQDIPLARKYGWVDETHGDAAILTTPGGDYVLVVMLHNKTWLDYDDSFPLIAEISRQAYNYFNVNAPMPQVEATSVPSCTLDTIEASLFPDLTSGSLPPIR